MTARSGEWCADCLTVARAGAVSGFRWDCASRLSFSFSEGAVQQERDDAAWGADGDVAVANGERGGEAVAGVGGVRQVELDDINVKLAREGIEPIRQPAPRTPLHSCEEPARINQEAEESLKFLDDFLASRSVTWLRSERLLRTASLKSRAAILLRTIAPDSRVLSLTTKPPGTTSILP
jgi:hypothetical protein